MFYREIIGFVVADGANPSLAPLISSNLGLGLPLAPTNVDSEMAELYMERLREYNELAAQYDEKYKDTAEDAEKNGGYIEVHQDKP